MRRLFKVGSDRHDVGRVTFSWHPDGNFLASAGKNGIVQITDRHGDIVDEIPMTTQAPVLSLSWDKDGDYLAILQDGNGVVPLWSLSNRRVVPLETNLKDPTFLAWSKSGSQLAVGTMKGNLLIYNKQTKKKIPIVGKHARKISCGSWSKTGNKLVLGSDDKTITISNENGDTLVHTEVKYIPTEVHFTTMSGPRSPRSSGLQDDDTISAVLDGKTLLLYNILDEKEEPMELAFASNASGDACKYGDIKHHEWLDEGLIIIGFTLGYILVVSSNPKEMGQEKNVARVHSSNLTFFAYNSQLKRIASAGDDGVRVVDLRDFKESKADFVSSEDIENGRITGLEWSPDGQILTIGTSAGNVYNFLAKMSVLNASYKSSIGFLSSLREVSIVDASRKGRPVDVTLKLEPSLIAIGASHVAAAMNNRVYYHKIGTGRDGAASPGGVAEQEYLGSVKEVRLNQTYAVVLTDSKATLHPIEESALSQEQTKTFPSREEGSFARIACIALTDDFMFYGTEAGTVEMFYLSEWVTLAGAELRLDYGIKQIFPNVIGTRVVIVDAQNQILLFNPVTGGGVNQSITRFESAPQVVNSVMWDLNEKNVILIFDGKFIHTYVYIQVSMKGTVMSKLGPISVSSEGEVSMQPDKFDVPSGNIPIMCIGGVITCQTVAGNLTTIVHPYFDQLKETIAAMGKSSDRRHKEGANERPEKKALVARFCQSLALLKLEAAWQTALELDRRQYWLALSNKAMELLNVELAIRVYRQLGDAGMVMALQDCVDMEDRFLLAGHISMLFCDYTRAQELFLASSRPTAALQMRRDLLHWDQAMKLAQALAPAQIPEICVMYGQQQEFRGEVDSALRMFESALNAVDDRGASVCPETLVPTAMMGVARCNLRLGNVRQGIRLANELEDKKLFEDCGEILEQQKQYTEAASMHLKGEQYERAAFVYTKFLIRQDKGRIPEAAAILEKVQNDQLNSAFAKACIGAGRFEEAARAYERAKDMDKVVELKLRNLDQVQQAFDIVRAKPSAQGAQHVADYCSEVGNFRGAIEFLLLANKSEDAFKLAQAQGMVEVYTTQLGDHISAEDALKVAHYYEKSQDFGKAGRFYSISAHYSRALKLFIQCGDREIDAAIEVVGKSQSEALTHQLIDFLVGEKDGVPKDPNYIYRLYMALKKYEDAAKTALIIARQEQEMGNYTLAHSVVFETIRHLEDAGIKVPLQLRQGFVLLHSYILVKSLVRSGNHMAAARMLLRVVQSVSKFPLHVVPILTSTVIECQRAGLKSSAYEHAVMLMRPEYRANIDVNLKRKIEAIVRRRSAQGDEPPEDVSPCPVSGQLIPHSQLECPTTRDALPMCAITGRHMVIDDWCFCPNSKGPALYSEYVRYIETELQTAKAAMAAAAEAEAEAADSRSEGKSSYIGSPKPPAPVLDPILGKPVSLDDLRLATPEDALKYIQRYNNVFEEKKDGEGAGDKEGEGDAVRSEAIPQSEKDEASSPVPMKSGRSSGTSGLKGSSSGVDSSSAAPGGPTKKSSSSSSSTSRSSSKERGKRVAAVK